MDSGSINYTYYVIGIIVLILLSAYFSATETAFSSLNKTKLKTIIENDKKNKRAELTLKLSEMYDKLLSTILIGNNIVNIAMASLGTVLFMNIYGDIGATISTAVITVLVLIFGEISPKSIAKDMPEKFAMFSAPMIHLLIILLTPINFLFTQWKKLLSKIFRIEEDNSVSSDELLTMVEEIQQNGNLDIEDGELIKNAIEFNERKAEDIITHRVDIEAISLETDKKDIAKKFTETQFSRLLVFEETIDNIVGVIHLKDFFTEEGITKQNIEEIMVKPLYIQKSENINDLLKILQKNKSHIAVVVDEFGGTHGIVTMEDILEELVGEIWDEHDEVVEFLKEVSDKVYEVDCSMDFDDFCVDFDIECETDSVSVGGWVMEQLGKIPEQDETFSFENLDVTILEIDSNRVIKIKVVENEKVELVDEDEKE